MSLSEILNHAEIAGEQKARSGEVEPRGCLKLYFAPHFRGQLTKADLGSGLNTSTNDQRLHALMDLRKGKK